MYVRTYFIRILIVLLQDDQTPLYRAAEHNHLTIVEFLLSIGAQEGIKDRVSVHTYTIIHYVLYVLQQSLCIICVYTTKTDANSIVG